MNRTSPDSCRASAPADRHVVLVASACSPHGGSELGVGYRFMLALRAHARLTVVTQPFWRPYLEADRTEHPERYKGVTLEYVSTGGLRGVLHENNLQPLNHLVWCWHARRRVREVQRRERVDLVHYLTLSLIWVPPLFFGVPGAPLVWGPVGGAERSDPRALRTAPGAFRLREAVRAGVIACARAAYRVLPTGDAAFARSADTAAVLGAEVPVMPETGVPDEAVEEALGATSPTARALATDAPYLVVSAGALTPRKNYRFALRSFAELLKKRPGGRYVLVGEGPEREALAALATQLGIDERLEMPGTVPHADAVALLQKADVCLHLAYREGASWTVFEALLSGTPVCAFQVAGLAALVHEGNGIPIPSHRADSDYVASRLDSYLAAPLAPRQIVASLAEHGWAAKGDTVAETYDRLLEPAVR